MINFNDSNLYVQYLQNFLKENYNRNLILTDVYDIDTHKTLIEYLKLPEIIESTKMKDLLIQKFVFRENEPPNKIINGGGLWNFNFDITPDYIKFYNRPLDECFTGGIAFIGEYMEEVKDFCKQYGWILQGYELPIYNKSDNNVLTTSFTLIKDTRPQLLPSKDIINMINLCTNEYLLNKCFIDENNAYHGFVQDSLYYKIMYVEAKPGDSFTIAHGYDYPCEIAIAYTNHSLKEIREDGYTVNNIVSYMEKSVNGMLYSDDYVIYTIPEDVECTYLLVQVPFLNSLLYKNNKTFKIKIGDINNDGKIDEDDLKILKQYVDYLSGKSSLPFTLSESKILAANINKDVDVNGKPIINESDVIAFENALENAKINHTKLDFGEINYERPSNQIETKLDKLLIMYGDITENNENNELNIPISEFRTNPWSIHDEFLSYLIGSTIHKHSHIEDITQLQKNIKKIFGEYENKRMVWGRYDEAKDFISNEAFVYNPVKSCYEYRNNDLFTGYVLNKSTPQNAELIMESTKRPSGVIILNGKWIENNQWNGKIVLNDGTICTQLAKNSLREIIKNFQIQINKKYKNQTNEEIKFINGYFTPLTEKYLNILLYDYDY